MIWLLAGACKPATAPPIPTDTDVPTVVPTPPPTPVPKPPTGSTAQTGSTGDTGDTAVFRSTADTASFSVGCDTADPTALGVPDCDGACYPAAFVGDGFICDDGTPRPWGTPNFDCAEFMFDGGDCAPTGDTG